MSLVEQAEKGVAAEVRWIQAYSNLCCEIVLSTKTPPNSAADANNAGNVGVRMMALFLQLPVLMPASDAFFRYLVLVNPKVEDMFEMYENANGDNRLVCADVKIVLNSIVAARPRTEYDALARLSYL